MHESKYSVSEYFDLLWLVTKAVTETLMQQNTQGLNILCCCFVNRIEWSLSEGWDVYVLF